MIWCVEDDSAIREMEVYTLNSTGFEAKGFEDGASFFEALEKEKPRLVLLDIMLPGDDGVNILKKLREDPATGQIPIIMATAKGQEYDKIQCLDLGADDYLVKPFGMMEMVSRIKAVLRRCEPVGGSNFLTAKGVRMNAEERTVTVDDERIELTYKEFELLKLFLMHPGMVFTREQIFAKVWDEDYIGESRTVDVHIRTLRQKLGGYADMIETVRNVGYKMEVNKS